MKKSNKGWISDGPNLRCPCCGAELREDKDQSYDDLISRKQAIDSAKYIFESDSEMKAYCIIKMLGELPSKGIGGYNAKTCICIKSFKARRKNPKASVNINAGDWFYMKKEQEDVIIINLSGDLSIALSKDVFTEYFEEIGGSK